MRRLNGSQMSSNRFKRQIFQIRHGGIRAFIQKFHVVRELIAKFDSRLFGQYRLRRKLLRVEPELASVVDRLSKTGTDTTEDNQVEALIHEVRELRDQNKLFSASRLLNKAQVDYPNSLKVLKNKAQVEFVHGNWQGFCSTLVAANELSDLLSGNANGSATRIRLMGNDWTGPLGHIIHLASIIKLERLGVLSNEKRILLYDPKYVANNFLLKLFLPLLNSVKASRFDIESFTNSYPTLFDDVTTFRLKDRVLDQWSAVDAANVGWIGRNENPLVNLSLEHLERGARVLKKWGLSESDWFVAMHIREGEHRDQARLPNANIDSYFPMIREIVERGGHVIRMGSPLMTPLPPMKSVVDYAHATERVDWMDAYLWATAKFFVGTQSGGSEAAMCFDTPTIRSNFSSYGHCFNSKSSFMVPKRYRLLGSEESLSLRAALQSPIPHCESVVHEGIKFEVIDNSEEDLVQAAQEMFSRLELNDWKLTDRQMKAQAIRLSVGAVGSLPISDSFLQSHDSFIDG